MLNDLTANSWIELQDLLFRDAYDHHLGRFRSSFIFRGLSDARYELKTSLMRLEGPYSELERHLLRNFRKYAHRNAVPGEWVAPPPARLDIFTFCCIAFCHGKSAEV